MFPACLLECSADKRWDHRAHRYRARAGDTTHIQTPRLYYTAGWLHCIPFAIWHRHVVLASDRCCTALVPEVTNDLLDCLFFFFSLPPSQRIICLTMAANATPGTLWSWRLLLLVFWDHIYLKWIVSVCTREAEAMPFLRKRGQEDDFLTTVLRLMPSTELNCRMATLLFSCHGDFLLLYRMNHH